SVISFAPPPKISVTWGTPPTVSCVVLIKCPSVTGCGGGTTASTTTALFGGIPEEFQDGFLEDMPMGPEDLGIPREIRVLAPTIPDVRVIHDIPNTITVQG